MKLKFETPDPTLPISSTMSIGNMRVGSGVSNLNIAKIKYVVLD